MCNGFMIANIRFFVEVDILGILVQILSLPRNFITAWKEERKKK